MKISERLATSLRSSDSLDKYCLLESRVYLLPYFFTNSWLFVMKPIFPVWIGYLSRLNLKRTLHLDRFGFLHTWLVPQLDDERHSLVFIAVSLEVLLQREHCSFHFLLLQLDHLFGDVEVFLVLRVDRFQRLRLFGHLHLHLLLVLVRLCLLEGLHFGIQLKFLNGLRFSKHKLNELIDSKVRNCISFSFQ